MQASRESSPVLTRITNSPEKKPDRPRMENLTWEQVCLQGLVTFEEEEKENINPSFCSDDLKYGFDSKEVNKLVHGVGQLSCHEEKEKKTSSLDKIIPSIFDRLPAVIEKKWLAAQSDEGLKDFIGSPKKLKDLAEEKEAVKRNFNIFWKLCISKTLEEVDPDFKHEIGTSDKNKHFNRLLQTHYTPFDFNVIADENGDQYSNASCLVYRNNQHIAAQAPFENINEDFLRMIFASGANTIITLTEAVEGGHEKCFPYWEMPEKEMENITLKLLEKNNEVFDTIDSQTISVRKFQLQQGNEKRIITQFHYRNWPDQKAPQIAIIEKFMELTLQHKVEGPLITHCSKGLGRTGTFIALYVLLQEVMEQVKRGIDVNDIEINLYETILKLRLQRFGLIQTPEQFQAIIDVMICFYDKLKTT